MRLAIYISTILYIRYGLGVEIGNFSMAVLAVMFLIMDIIELVKE